MDGSGVTVIPLKQDFVGNVQPLLLILLVPGTVAAVRSTSATEVETAAPVQQLQLVQERMDLEAELEAMQTKVDLSELEDEFVAVAATYGARKGISYAAWREVGVDAAVLKRAGVRRGS